MLPPGFVRDIVERVTPSVLAAQRAGHTSTEEVEAEHVRQTVRLLVDRSALLSERRGPRRRSPSSGWSTRWTTAGSASSRCSATSTGPTDIED